VKLSREENSEVEVEAISHLGRVVQEIKKVFRKGRLEKNLKEQR
jgi:hypothetical protein